MQTRARLRLAVVAHSMASAVPVGRRALASADIELIARWICQGAPNN